MEEFLNIGSSLKEVRKRIEYHCQMSGREPGSVKLIVVTKTHPPGTIRKLTELGVLDIGESYVDEFKKKYADHDDRDIRWHFIGHLARKNTPKVVGKAEFIHSVASLRLARKIDLTAGRNGITQKVLLQVNTSEEGTKQGFSADDVMGPELIDELALLENIQIKGLMTMAPYMDDENILRSCFGTLRETLGRIREVTGWELSELSMGMTNDYGIAIEEGATMIRIGTAILGGQRARASSPSVVRGD